MKKFLFLTLAALLMITMIGCDDDDDPTEEVNPPTNLVVTTTDGNQLNLAWNPSTTTGVTYQVLFNDVVIATNLTVNQFAYTAPELGVFEVIAVDEDDEESDAVSFSTHLVTGTSNNIYTFSTAGQPSGFGWNTNGVGTVYSFTADNLPNIDMYLDDDQDFASPDLGSANPDARTSFLGDMTSYDNMGLLPVANAANYTNAATGTINSNFAISFEIGGSYYYVKCKVVEAGANYSKISYGFQRIPNYRLMD